MSTFSRLGEGSDESESVKYHRALGEQLGAREFRARCKAILTSPEAIGARFEMALHLCLETDLSAPEVIATLRAAPKIKATRGEGGEGFYRSQVARAAGHDPDDHPGLSSRFVRETAEMVRRGEIAAEPSGNAKLRAGLGDRSAFFSDSEKRFGK